LPLSGSHSGLGSYESAHAAHEKRLSRRVHLLRAFEPRDLISRLAIGIGFRDEAYRRRAVDLLQVVQGDVVVELGCGTGRNFALLERAVGPRGTVIAVDVSAPMLARARARAARHLWTNVEFVHSDVAEYSFPAHIDAVLATYTLVIVPEYDWVIGRALAALKDGGRCVVLDQKVPSGAASVLVPLLDVASRPFHYSRIVGKRRLWEALQRHAGNVRVEERYFGFVYLAVAEKMGAVPGGVDTHAL
jgi:S-adenosylmethionine-diacylgycerolhomoserine-N-methlytransferase